jgi:hypothetical protein
MNSRALQIAHRIALIKAEFSENDILAAVKMLEEKGTSSAILEYLSGRPIHAAITKEIGRKTKPVAEQRSKAVLDLEHKDPDKFKLLSEFDSLLRKGSVFPHLDDIKRLGERLSKDFTPRNSRREIVAKLMVLLAGRPIDEIKEIVKEALSSAQLDNKSDEYQELAQFLITGKASQTISE